MQIASIIDNDIQNGITGTTVSLWVSGCPHHCEECHNKQLWDYSYGSDLSLDDLKKILPKMITANGITRDFSVLGGEPLDPSKREDLTELLKYIKSLYPEKFIYLWTGYNYKDIKNLECLKYVDFLIDGKFISSQRDVTLLLRGSTNQNLYIRHGKRFFKYNWMTMNNFAKKYIKGVY